MKILVSVLSLEPMHWYRVKKDVTDEARDYASKLFGPGVDYDIRVRESTGKECVVEIWKDAKAV